MWWRGVLCFAAAVLVTAVGGAQGSSPVGALDVSRDAVRTFPVLRNLGGPPPVPVTGAVPLRSGSMTTIPISAAFAFADMQWYGRQLETLFPMSGPLYPADSLRALRAARAKGWIERLRAERAAGHPGVTGWELVPFAQLAVLADDDSLAIQLFDARAAELTQLPVEQVYVYSEAVAAFVDPLQPAAQLTARLRLAERYVARLRKIPLQGYHTRQDNFSVVTRRARVEDTVIVAYDILGVPSQVLAHAEERIKLVAYLTPENRGGLLMQAYRPAALSLALHLGARAQFDTLHRCFTEITRSITTTWAGDSVSSRAQNIANFTENAHATIKVVDEALAWIGTDAPAIPGHAWLNTSDSAYQQAPRERTFRDGKVHVVLFMGVDDDGSESVLQRLQRAFPHQVETLLVTATTGANGPDLVATPSEVAWLERFYVGLRKFSTPIAIWGGVKVPAEQSEGKVGHVPESSPVDTSRYRFRMGAFAIIDGNGKVRAFQDGSSRLQESLLWQRVQSLLADSVQMSGRQ